MHFRESFKPLEENIGKHLYDFGYWEDFFWGSVIFFELDTKSPHYKGE